MSDFKYGDYVAYNPGYTKEVGRFVRDTSNGCAVCYHDGCTSANTPLQYLRLATREEIEKASRGIGYHRFDVQCPDYNPDCCYGCVHDIEGK